MAITEWQEGNPSVVVKGLRSSFRSETSVGDVRACTKTTKEQHDRFSL